MSFFHDLPSLLLNNQPSYLKNILRARILQFFCFHITLRYSAYLFAIKKTSKPKTTNTFAVLILSN